MTAAWDAAQPEGQTSTGLDWSSLLAENASWMRSVVLARVGEPQAVDEVFQEVALAAVAQKAPLLDATRVGPWLYRLVVVHALRYRRGQARRRHRIAAYQLQWAERTNRGVLGETAWDPLQLLLRDERRQITAGALRRLAGRDAEILLLKYGERWSCARIAGHLGIGIGAVEGRLHRARERLRVELKDISEERQ